MDDRRQQAVQKAYDDAPIIQLVGLVEADVVEEESERLIAEGNHALTRLSPWADA